MQYIKVRLEGCILYTKVGKSIDHFVLVDRILLSGRLCIWLSENRLRGEDVLFEEALLDELLQVPSEGLAIDGLVSLAVVVGAVLFRPEQ